MYNDHGTKSAQGKTSIELEVDSYYFEPTFVRGDPGQKLEVELKNDAASTTHNFTVTAQNVDTDIPAKGKATITITIPQAGVVGFFCKFHTGQGMNGELLAGDAAPQPVGAVVPGATPTGSTPSYPPY